MVADPLGNRPAQGGPDSPDTAHTSVRSAPTTATLKPALLRPEHPDRERERDHHAGGHADRGQERPRGDGAVADRAE